MINLIPHSTFLYGRRIYRFRLTVVALILFCVLCILSIGFILPSLLIVQEMRASVSQSLQTAKARPVSHEADEITHKVEEVNLKVRMLIDIPTAPYVTAFLDKILLHKTSGVSITYINLGNNGEITIKGVALKREDLINFSQALSKDINFSNVASPISNLIASENINFTINMDLSKKTNE